MISGAADVTDDEDLLCGMLNSTERHTIKFDTIASLPDCMLQKDAAWVHPFFDKNKTPQTLLLEHILPEHSTIGLSQD